MNPEIEKKLRPWQIVPANHLLRILQKDDSALDCSDTGVGKTFLACAIAKELSLPTLVVVPKISISMWHRTAACFEDTLSVINYEKLRTGRSLYGKWTNQEQIDAGPEGRTFDYVCCFCQRRITFGEAYLPCIAEARGIHCVECKPRPIIRGVFNFDKAIGFVIFDECHRCGGMKSQNADLLIAAKRQKIKHLMLSATPAQNILQMRAIGYSLDLFTL